MVIKGGETTCEKETRVRKTLSFVDGTRISCDSCGGDLSGPWKGDTTYLWSPSRLLCCDSTWISIQQASLLDQWFIVTIMLSHFVFIGPPSECDFGLGCTKKLLLCG